MFIRFNLLLFLVESALAWCPDSKSICTCSGSGCNGDDTITCVIEGVLPSLQPGDSNGHGICHWKEVNLVINDIPSLNSTIFSPGFTMCNLNIEQNSARPIPFGPDDSLLSNAVMYECFANGGAMSIVTVTSLSGSLPFHAFDTVHAIHLSFSGVFTVAQSLPRWLNPTSLQSLTLNSSVYSDMPWNVFENLECSTYTIDIYNFTVIKSHMFIGVGSLVFCNVDHMESFGISHSTMSTCVVDNPYNWCTNKSAAVSQIDAHAFHNTTVTSLGISVTPGADIQDWSFDALMPAITLLALVITDTLESNISCGSLGNLTRYSLNLDVAFGGTKAEPAMFSALCGMETASGGLAILGNNLECSIVDCKVNMDALPKFHDVTGLILEGFNGITLSLNITTHFPNISTLEIAAPVCETFLLSLPSVSTLAVSWIPNPSIAPPIPLRFQGLSQLRMTFLETWYNDIECSCSMSWMLQLRDCHSSMEDDSVDGYLAMVSCSNRPGSVSDFLRSSYCCNSTDEPSYSSCDLSTTIPPALLSFDARDLPQCRSTNTWRFDPCDVQSFYDSPVTTTQPPTEQPTTSTPTTSTTCNDLTDWCTTHQNMVFSDPLNETCSNYYFVCANYNCYKLYCPWFPIHTYFDSIVERCVMLTECP